MSKPLTQQMKETGADQISERTKRLVEEINQVRQTQAQSADELAEMLEPLAQAMADLSDEAAGRLMALQQQGAQDRKKAVQQWQQAVKALREQGEQTRAVAQEAEAAMKHPRRLAVTVAVIVGLIAGLPSGWLIWQHQLNAQTEQEARAWNKLMDNTGQEAKQWIQQKISQ